MRRHQGLVLVLAGAAGYAALPLFAKGGHAAGLTAVEMNAVRLTAAALVFFALIGLSRAEAARMAPRDLAWVCAVGVLDYGLASLLYFTALETLDASLAHVVVYTYPAMVVVLARLAFGEPLSQARLAALALSAAGCALVIGLKTVPSFTPAFFGAVGLVLATALIYAVYNIAGQALLGRYRPLTVVAWTSASAAVALLALDLPRLPRYPAMVAAHWPLLLGMTLVSTVGALLLYVSGLGRVGASRAVLTATVEPLITVALAAAILGERFSPGQWLGGGLVVAAVVLAQRPARAPAAAVPARIAAAAGD